MKKTASLIFAVLTVCAAMIFTAVPAFAASEPTKLDVKENIKIDDGGVYVISSGNHTVQKLEVLSGTLIIGSQADVTVSLNADIRGTVIISGALRLSRDNPLTLYGKIYVDGGRLTGYGSYSGTGAMIRGHAFDNGICKGCGYQCQHSGGFSDGKCSFCGWECPHTHTKTVTVCEDCGLETGIAGTGSMLSEGSLTLIVGVACLAVGFLAATFIFKTKKKPAAAGTENTNEE